MLLFMLRPYIYFCGSNYYFLSCVCMCPGHGASVEVRGRSSGLSRNCLPTLHFSPVFLLNFKALKTQGTIQPSPLVLFIKHERCLKHQVGYNHLHRRVSELSVLWESQELKSVWDRCEGMAGSLGLWCQGTRM